MFTLDDVVSRWEQNVGEPQFLYDTTFFWRKGWFGYKPMLGTTIKPPHKFQAKRGDVVGIDYKQKMMLINCYGPVVANFTQVQEPSQNDLDVVKSAMDGVKAIVYVQDGEIVDWLS